MRCCSGSARRRRHAGRRRAGVERSAGRDRRAAAGRASGRCAAGPYSRAAGWRGRPASMRLLGVVEFGARRSCAAAAGRKNSAPPIRRRRRRRGPMQHLARKPRHRRPLGPQPHLLRRSLAASGVRRPRPAVRRSRLRPPVGADDAHASAADRRRAAARPRRTADRRSCGCPDAVVDELGRRLRRR